MAGAGFVISYLSVIVLYMFGQLVDNSDIVAENSERQVALLKDIKTSLAEPCTGLSTKANRQTNLLEEIQRELARCHAADVAEETTIEEVPVEETPVEETPVEETPVEENPVEDASIEETPAEEIPGEDVPMEAPVEEGSAEPETAPEMDEAPSPAPFPVVACKKCGFVLVNEVRDLSDSVFCPGCGSKLSEQTKPEGVCPGCGYDKAFGKFCPRCGLKQHD